ncbi:MAG: hypothetical protein GY809_02710, partial [Planctomycetes bacterium]|nr:hypothetical protein [Planctomycetota bacterium]
SRARSRNVPWVLSGPWAAYVLVGACALAVVAAAATRWMPRSSAPVQAVGSVLTHTVTHGDLIVTVTEQGTLESAENTEIKCKVRGENVIIWVIESGSFVKAGDELIRLDTLAIEDAIAEQTKTAHLTRSGAERAKANMARAELAVPEYLEGRYRTAVMTLEKTLTIASSNLLTAQNMLAHAETMDRRGYVSGLELQEKRFAVTQAELYVGVTETQIKELKDFTKAMEMETLKGALNTARARYDAEAERARLDADRRDLVRDELKHCVVKAQRDGLVIYPRSHRWKRTPDIEEGATVHKDQALLLMPDLLHMQVKVGIHESVVDKIRPGMTARIAIPGHTLVGEVATVAPVTRPGGWWSGNVVKYDTVISLPSMPGLKPGMTAEVVLVIARHENVLTVPLTAVAETAQGAFCWIQTVHGIERRALELGDNDHDFAVVHAGLQPGDEVVLDALASVPEAQAWALNPKANVPLSAQEETDHVN